jgi:hypothetical protein
MIHALDYSPADGSDRAPLPFGYVSLLAMINCQIFGLCHALLLLAREQEAAGTRQGIRDPSRITASVVRRLTGPQEYTKEDGERISELLKYWQGHADRLSLTNTNSRLERFRTKVRLGMDLSDFEAELRTLREAIEDDLHYRYFYHYPPEKARILMCFEQEWAQTIEKFPSAKEEIRAATDCYALGHNTACVFHTMRVAEYGLRALARERSVSFPKKPLEWANWQEILEQMESNIRALGRTMQAGSQKDAALGFYNGAVAQFHGFKDVYRNMIMHVRRGYDEFEALRAINQVRDFMNGLSRKIGEKTNKPIRRWP